MNLIGIYNSSAYFFVKGTKNVRKRNVSSNFPRVSPLYLFSDNCNGEQLKGSISAIFRGIAAAMDRWEIYSYDVSGATCRRAQS